MPWCGLLVLGYELKGKGYDEFYVKAKAIHNPTTRACLQETRARSNAEFPCGIVINRPDRAKIINTSQLLQ